MDLNEVIESLGDHLTNKDRPFTGQPHTDQGERGKTVIKDIRFRDLADCLARAWIHSAAFTIEDETVRDDLYERCEDGTLNYNDLYLLNVGEMDPVALIKNACCEVEKAMGIFPNVPELEVENNENVPG